eukprot:jgi/Ulvmu1/10818/UM069_0054.1
MFRSICTTFAIAAIVLLSPAAACRCFPPPPLSECSVRDNTAALLVTLKCVKTVACNINDGVAVADVVIDKVFKDNTRLSLSEGDMVTVRSPTQGSLCGIGGAFRFEEQWILFGSPFRTPPLGIAEEDGTFSDGTICNVEEADLSTDTCSGNIIEPTKLQIMELMDGCSD